MIIHSPYTYTGHPIIHFASGLEEVIGPEKWTVRSGGGVFASRRQLPLKLAWAISIHKSQVSDDDEWGGAHIRATIMCMLYIKVG